MSKNAHRSKVARGIQRARARARAERRSPLPPSKTDDERAGVQPGLRDGQWSPVGLFPHVHD